jgi:UDP-N-acetylglucosamine 2-epimerase
VTGTVHVTGDVLADVLLATRSRLPAGGEEGEYVLATAHRNYNTDSPERLAAVLDCLAAAGRRVIFPVHPRTRKSIQTWGLQVPANVEVRDPVTYTQMLALERDAVAIATDSGGVQREAYLWGVPCVTMREETEWIETVSTGWNTLVGADAAAFQAAMEKSAPAERPPIFGDGTASRRIAGLTVSLLEQEPSRERSYV